MSNLTPGTTRAHQVISKPTAGQPPSTHVRLNYILKISSRCNLNCTYCYVYNKGDDSWRNRPPFMSREIFRAAVERIRRHCLHSGQDSVQLVFHGGEPCLAGVERMAEFMDTAMSHLQDLVMVSFAVQTNGTLLSDEFLELFGKYDVAISVSLDGPPAINDKFRVDHAGRGTATKVEENLRRLKMFGHRVRILSVISLGADSLAIHKYFCDLGCDSVEYLFPDYTHDTIRSVRSRFGSTPCADFLIPIFDDWSAVGGRAVTIPVLETIMRLILGGTSSSDYFGNKPFRFAFIESDGAIEGLDVIRTCKGGLAATGLNVLYDDFRAIAVASALRRREMFEGVPLSGQCESCTEGSTCAGGYLPHRYSVERGFDNPSVWCNDFLKLFGHMRTRLGVSPEATHARRVTLHALASKLTTRRVASEKAWATTRTGLL